MKSTLGQTNAQVRTRVAEQSAIDSVTSYSISVMGGVSALVGLWAATCFVAALLGGGGPLELAQSWFRAIAGL